MGDALIVILAGGFGTRLRPFTPVLPKPFVPVLNRPAISYSFELITNSSLRDVVVLYEDEFLRSAVESVWGEKLRLTWFRDVDRSGTGSALRLIPAELRGNDILVLPADIANDVNLDTMLRDHRAARAAVTLACAPVKAAQWSGDVLDLDDDRQVWRYRYRPPAQSGLVYGSCGVHVFAPGAFWTMIAGSQPLDLSSEVFPALTDQDIPVHAHLTVRCGHDFGTPQRIKYGLHKLFAGELPGTGPSGASKDIVWASPGAHVDPTARVTGPILLGDGAVLGPHATVVGPACIGQSTIVGANAVVDRAILMPGTQVLPDSYVGRGIIGEPKRVRAVVEDLLSRDPDALIRWPRRATDFIRTQAA